MCYGVQTPTKRSLFGLEENNETLKAGHFYSYLSAGEDKSPGVGHGCDEGEYDATRVMQRGEETRVMRQGEETRVMRQGEETRVK
jgi:hypothetical protein